MAVPAAEATGRGGGRRAWGGTAGQGAPRTTSQEETLARLLPRPALLSLTQGTAFRDTQEAPVLPPGNTGSKWTQETVWGRRLEATGAQRELSAPGRGNGYRPTSGAKAPPGTSKEAPTHPQVFLSPAYFQSAVS